MPTTRHNPKIVFPDGREIEVKGLKGMHLDAPKTAEATIGIQVFLPDHLQLVIELENAQAGYLLLNALWAWAYQQAAGDVSEAMGVIQKLVSGEYRLTTP